MEGSPGPAGPSPDEVAQATEVSHAAAGAIAEAQASGASPEQTRTAAADAIRKRSAQVGLQLSDEDVKRLAGALTDEMMERMSAMGAFDPPPAPEPAPAAAPDPNSPAAPAAAAAETGAVPPRKLSWAEKHFGTP